MFRPQLFKDRMFRLQIYLRIESLDCRIIGEGMFSVELLEDRMFRSQNYLSKMFRLQLFEDRMFRLQTFLRIEYLDCKVI